MSVPATVWSSTAVVVRSMDRTSLFAVFAALTSSVMSMGTAAFPCGAVADATGDPWTSSGRLFQVTFDSVQVVPVGLPALVRYSLLRTATRFAALLYLVMFSTTDWSVDTSIWEMSNRK